MDDKELKKLQAEAAAWRTLVGHLQKRTDVQNIDLMNLSGFCRNCMARWYRVKLEEQGIFITDALAREEIYGMPYTEYKKNHQQKATEEQLALYNSLAPDQTTE